MSRRTLLFCTCAVLSAFVFTRLGLWQVARLRERQARNAMIWQQEQRGALSLVELPHDAQRVHYQAATVDGRFDYAHELVLSGRTRRGSPGVELLTPVRIPGRDTAVLVNRGWVYSPDAGSVDRARWHEGDRAHVAGYVELYGDDAGVTSASDPRVIRHITRAEIASKIPYPVADFYLVAGGDTTDLSHPARRDLPLLDDGPHRGYAFQWFSFALMALGGAVIVVWKERTMRFPA